jgi:hypothetical protein
MPPPTDQAAYALNGSGSHVTAAAGEAQNGSPDASFGSAASQMDDLHDTAESPPACAHTSPAHISDVEPANGVQHAAGTAAEQEEEEQGASQDGSAQPAANEGATDAAASIQVSGEKVPAKGSQVRHCLPHA